MQLLCNHARPKNYLGLFFQEWNDGRLAGPKVHQNVPSQLHVNPAQGKAKQNRREAKLWKWYLRGNVYI